jgi:cyclophilin family peptidyl-prolyl cis-trans isomerase/HEAT repeat protein
MSWPLLSLALVARAASPDVAAIQSLEWARAPVAAITPATRAQSSEVRRAAAVALGRSRDPAAIPTLEALSGDDDPSVRIAAAEALAAIDGAAPALRAWLGRLPPSPASSLPRGGDGVAERAAVVRALGRVGDGTDVPALILALSDAAPVSTAAAHALSDLGRAGEPAAASAVPALVARLSAWSAGPAEAAAHALRRIGLAAHPELAASVADAAARGRSPTLRAWALAACWPALSVEQRSALAARALADADLVRVALLDQVGPGDVDASAVIPSLVRSPQVRAAAIGALGRVGGDDALAALRPLLAGGDPFEAADATRAYAAAGGEVPPPPPDAHPERIAAWLDVAASSDEALARLDDPSPVVRSAAATALARGPSLRDLADMLASEDAVVRQIGAESAGLVPLGAHALLTALMVEEHAAVWLGALPVLADDEDTRGDRRRADVLARGAAHADPRVRAAVAALTGATLVRAGEVGAVVPAPRPREARVVGLVVNTTEGVFRIALDGDTAPLAVETLASLAAADFYDGLVFHRVVPGFVAQGGCPRGDGWGGPAWELPDEIGFAPYGVGSVGIARSGPDSGGSQWFVTLADTPHLEGRYTRVGAVTSGLEVVQRLARGDRVIDVVVEELPR